MAQVKSKIQNSKSKTRELSACFRGQSSFTIPVRVNETLIIVPTYNERENLPRIAAKLLSLPVGVDVLVVDDNSPDGTGRFADELAAQHPQIHVLHRTEKNGLGRAYIAGFKWALARQYEFIFEMDCDFSHDPDDIAQFLAAAKNQNAISCSDRVTRAACAF
jgi:glycosyltransferase involved in cell wall biosynthesis